jgi:hypothetical protein
LLAEGAISQDFEGFSSNIKYEQNPNTTEELALIKTLEGVPEFLEVA